jgi:hypothetical protein
MKRVRGPVARMDVLTEDARRLDSAGAMVPDHSVPVMALPPHPPGGHRDGHAGSVLVGRGELSTAGDLLLLEGVILEEQEVEVPVGRYPCGLDMRVGDGDVEERDGVLVFHSWIPIGVTLHLDGGRNAFTGLDELEVYEA